MTTNWQLRTIDAANIDALRPAALFDLRDKVAVVTGAGGGLGAWFSAGLAAAGAHVMLTDHPRNPTGPTAAAICESGGIAHEYECDLLTDHAAENIVAATVAHFGRVENREQQVLDRQIFMTGLARLMERVV